MPVQRPATKPFPLLLARHLWGIIAPLMLRTDRVEASFDYQRLSSQVVDLLRDYLMIDTTNPPGDVSRAAAWVADLLSSEGIEHTRLDRSPPKANLVATLPGAGEEPLVLAHHMDVVPAVAEDWDANPFGGELRDGYVWVVAPST